MPASEAQRKGAELRRKLMGDAYVDRINQTVYDDPAMQKFREVTTETIFGTLWTRPGLDLKTRTLVHLLGYVGAPLVREAMLTAKEVFAEIRKER